MKNKYYTPEITEFHIGFEFQSNYLEKDWVEKKLTLEDIAHFFDSYILDATPLEFRVKHLDREDIESLGWKFISEPYEKKYKLNENYSLYLEHKEIKNVRIIYTNDWGDISLPIFSGTIKNKSELKKLMQMLNIE